MPAKDPRVDAYIAKAKPFAKPILTHVRRMIFKVCPDVVETIKWGMPSYEYHGILCGMAAFKAHATFGFWKHSLLIKHIDRAKKSSEDAMGSMGKILSKDDLPSDAVLTRLIREAMKLNEKGIKATRAPKSGAALKLVVPDYFMDALKKNKAALAIFEAFSYSHRKEYVEWIAGAKREETRRRRMATAIEWIAKGKPQNWKYMTK